MAPFSALMPTVPAGCGRSTGVEEGALTAAVVDGLAVASDESVDAAETSGFAFGENSQRKVAPAPRTNVISNTIPSTQDTIFRPMFSPGGMLLRRSDFTRSRRSLELSEFGREVEEGSVAELTATIPTGCSGESHP